MTLAQPIWLFGLLLLPVLVIGALVVWRRRAKRWRALVAARLESRLVIGASRTAEVVSLGLLLLGTACIIGALARPQGQARNTTETIRGRNVIIMLDVSRSMLTPDVKPSRLAHAKATAHEMVDALPNDRVGIIAMAGRPFLVAPVTIDHAAVHETISQLDEATIPLGGTDISSAVGMAVRTFKETGQKNNGLIILSDGEDHAEGLKQAAEEARDAGVFIFAVGIGTAQGELVPDPLAPGGVFLDRNGREVLSRLEERKLRQLATDTNGRYVSSAAGVDIPAMAREAVTGLDEYDIRSATRSIPLEFYQWLLLPGTLLWIASVVVATRWRALAMGPKTGAAAVLLLGMLLSGLAQGEPRPAALGKLPAHGSMPGDDFAMLAQRSSGERAAAYRLAAGNEAYKRNDWASAGEAFSAALLARNPALQASGHYNLGTALFQQGWEQLTAQPPYPGPERGPAAFEEAIARRFDEWNKVPATAEAPSPTYELLRAVTIAWSDAINHYRCALRLKDTPTTRDNLALARHYLQKLRDALEAQNEELEDELPPEQKGKQPESGDDQGQPQQPGEGQPNNQGGPPQEGAPGKEPSDQPPPGGDKQDPKADSGEGGDKPQEQPGEGGQPNKTPGQNKDDELDRDFQPGESAQDRARRLLGEGSDLERSLVPPGRHEFRRPDKDW